MENHKLPPINVNNTNNNNCEDRLNELYVDYIKSYSTHDLLKNGLTSIETTHYNKITKYASWLNEVIIMTENIPICVSISSHEKTENVNYPLVYVNKAFEETTGYPRDEIVGKNCKFLQKKYHESNNDIENNNNEINAISQMTTSLSKGENCKVLITNYKKDGTSFRNLLNLFPIKYKSGEICYYIGIQCDVTNPKTPYNYIMLVDDLMSILPKIIDADDNTTVSRYLENMIESIGIYKDIEHEYKPTKPMKTTKRSISHRRDSILIPRGMNDCIPPLL